MKLKALLLLASITISTSAEAKCRLLYDMTICDPHLIVVAFQFQIPTPVDIALMNQKVKQFQAAHDLDFSSISVIHTDHIQDVWTMEFGFLPSSDTDVKTLFDSFYEKLPPGSTAGYAYPNDFRFE